MVQLSFYPSRASSPILCVTGASWPGPMLAHSGSGVIQDVARARNRYDLTWQDCWTVCQMGGARTVQYCGFFWAGFPIWHPAEGPVFLELP